MRRPTRTGGVLAVTAALALTACTTTGTHQPQSLASNPPPKAPAAELADAAGHLQDDTFAMTMTVKVDTTNARLDGVMDPAKKIGAFTATSDRNGTHTVTEWRILGDAVYLNNHRQGLPGATNKPWQRLSTADGATLAGSSDGTTMAGPLTRPASVQRTSPHHYTGTFTTAAIVKALSLTTSAAGAGPSTAPTMTFTADLDPQGHLSHYHLDIPRSTGNTYPIDLTYSHFGTPVTVQAPPADQIAGTIGT